MNRSSHPVPEGYVRVTVACRCIHAYQTVEGDGTIQPWCRACPDQLTIPLPLDRPDYAGSIVITMSDGTTVSVSASLRAQDPDWEAHLRKWFEAYWRTRRRRPPPIRLTNLVHRIIRPGECNTIEMQMPPTPLPVRLETLCAAVTIAITAAHGRAGPVTPIDRNDAAAGFADYGGDLAGWSRFTTLQRMSRRELCYELGIRQ